MGRWFLQGAFSNAETLQEITKLAPSSLEIAESLEQLRWVENGYTIQTFLTDYDNVAVDIPEDILIIEKKFPGSE